MTGFIGMLGVLLAVGGVTPQAVPVTQTVLVKTPIFAAKGSVFGGTRPVSLAIGTPEVLFASSGSTLCAASAPTSVASDDAGYGWRIEATSRELTADGVLVIDLAWQRRWQDGRASEGPVSRTQVRLAQGGRIQLDYLGAPATSRCDAVGMALEISRPPRPAVGLFEAEAWLMPAVYGDPIQRQVVRLREGDSGKFYFDEIDVGSAPGKAQVEGTLTLETHASGRFESMLNIARRDSTQAPGAPSGGSSGFPLKAAFGETVEFRVPMGGFSLRVRVRQLR